MPWNVNTYIYTQGVLRAIVRGYESIYDWLLLSYHSEVESPWGRVEYKSDFDMALDAIGKGRWCGEVYPSLSHYRYFGRLQRMVIADIIGTGNDELEALGFYDIPRLKGYAYSVMCRFLNTGGTGFITKK